MRLFSAVVAIGILVGVADTFWAAQPASASSAQLEDSTPRRTLTGIAVDAAGEPVAGVQYWINNFYTDQGGELQYSGEVRKTYTDGTGHFRCEFGGQGRPEVGISVAFLHPKYAPTWAIKKRSDESPVSVQLDPGVELKGIAAVNGHRAGGYLFQWPLHLRLHCVNANLGGWATRIEAQTDAKGRFTFRIPTDYATCHYSLYFAGHKLPLKLQSGKPPPFIELRNTVEMDLKPVESQDADE